jgi:DNA invertase Pin-like site-specific DNA recombinase
VQAPQTPSAPRAVGYATGSHVEEVERHAVAIQRACEARGWTLAAIVRDSPAGRRGRALNRALDKATGESAPHLVVGRLEHVGGSLREIATLLSWCGRHKVALVALDVGLDTTTPEGKTAVRRLLGEVAARGRARQRGHVARRAGVGLSPTAQPRG